MNGVDAVVIATGNDWRAIEAGAHAYAARSGRYTSLSTWGKTDGKLTGELEMPMAVGMVGGATRVHPRRQAALKLMGVKKRSELAEIIVCRGAGAEPGGPARPGDRGHPARPYEPACPPGGDCRRRRRTRRLSVWQAAGRRESAHRPRGGNRPGVERIAIKLNRNNGTNRQRYE